MKSISIIFLLLSISSIGLSQYAIPEILESDKRTQFSHTIFRVNYHKQKTLERFLEQSSSEISFDTDSLSVIGRDLFVKSPEYRYKNLIVPLVKGEYLTSKERKLGLIDSVLTLESNWRTAIIENESLVNDIVLRIMQGFKFEINNAMIHAEGPPPYEDLGNSIYKYEFDDKYKLISKGIGRITKMNEFLYWLTTTYEYKKGRLVKEVQTKCYDIKCSKGSEVEIKVYGKQGLKKIAKQTYSRHDNQFIFEEKTDYYYAKGVLDSARMNYWFVAEETPRVTRTKFYTYENGLLSSMKDTYLTIERVRDQKSIINYNYDSLNRLMSTEYEGVNNNDEVITKYTEEFEYQANSYVYRYKESFKKKRREEILPLQYEMVYTFY